MARLTDDRIKQLRELASKATQPGPYRATNHRNQARDNFVILDANGFWVGDFGNVKSEADYFAGAATAVPELLDEVTRLRAALRAALDMAASASRVIDDEGLDFDEEGPAFRNRIAELRKLVQP